MSDLDNLDNLDRDEGTRPLYNLPWIERVLGKHYGSIIIFFLIFIIIISILYLVHERIVDFKNASDFILKLWAGLGPLLGGVFGYKIKKG